MTADNIFEESHLVERRKFVRIPFNLMVHYKTIKNGKIFSSFESMSLDLSAGGLGLKSEQRLEIGQMLMLNLFLPVKSEGDKEEQVLVAPTQESLPVSVLAKVVWCAQVAAREHRFGVQFLELDWASRKRLKSFLSENCLNWNDSNLFR